MRFRVFVVFACAALYVATWFFVMIVYPWLRHWRSLLSQEQIALAVKTRQGLRRAMSFAQMSALDKDLHRACAESDTARVSRLLHQGADPNAFGAHSLSHGRSSLHNAARQGNLAITRLLVNFGANSFALDNPFCPIPFMPFTDGSPVAAAIRGKRGDWEEVVVLLKSAQKGTIPRDAGAAAGTQEAATDPEPQASAHLDPPPILVHPFSGTARAGLPPVSVAHREAAPAADAADGLPPPPPPPNGEGGRKCAVCLDGPLENIVLPCGHLCLCSTCGIRVAEMRPPRCPICRQGCTSVTRVYY